MTRLLILVTLVAGAARLLVVAHDAAELSSARAVARDHFRYGPGDHGGIRYIPDPSQRLAASYLR